MVPVSFDITATAPPRDFDPTPDSMFMESGESDPAPNRDDKPTKLCAEPGCSNPSALTPTGRQGKYCEVHKKSNSGTKASKPTQNRTKWAKAPEVENALNQLTNFLALGVAGLAVSADSDALALDAQVLNKGMPKVNHELVELAKNDPSFQKYLNWLASPGKYGALTMASLAVIVPILGNHNLIPGLPALFGAGSATDERKE